MIKDRRVFQDTLFPLNANPPHAHLRHGDDSRVIFVTNRGPIEHHFTEGGQPVARYGAGGVVSGLLCAARGRPVSWISVAMTDADRALAQPHGNAVVASSCGLKDLTARLVYIHERTYSRYYDGISNRLLWFAQHGLPHARTAAARITRERWEKGYVVVNEALGHAAVAELEARGHEAPVIFHDYHLYLAPRIVRERVPEARLLHFIHIPWPSPQQWANVPEEMMRDIYEGLASNDVIGFQTVRDVRNFLLGAERYLPEAELSRDPDALYWQGRHIALRAYPIELTPATVRKDALAPEAVEQAEALRRQLHLDEGHKLIVRVDRVEPAKNIVRGFEAYERLLRSHPEMHGTVTFLALLVPSREGVWEYRRYAARVQACIDRINARYGTEEWQPIIAIYGNDRARALACMRYYDVLLVNSLADGMNLVVKEGGLLNTRNGVTVLSHRVGAYARLRHGALGISPDDVRATAEELYHALTMPTGERKRLADRLREDLERESGEQWLHKQLHDLIHHARHPWAVPAPSPAMSVASWLAHETSSGMHVRLPSLEQQRARPASTGGPTPGCHPSPSIWAMSNLLARTSRQIHALTDRADRAPAPVPRPLGDASATHSAREGP